MGTVVWEMYSQPSVNLRRMRYIKWEERGRK